ncbi:MAG: hypothetical protein ACYTHJ_13150 [Planctomycetota bacterium]
MTSFHGLCPPGACCLCTGDGVDHGGFAVLECDCMDIDGDSWLEGATCTLVDCAINCP